MFCVTVEKDGDIKSQHFFRIKENAIKKMEYILLQRLNDLLPDNVEKFQVGEIKLSKIESLIQVFKNVQRESDYDSDEEDEDNDDYDIVLSKIEFDD